MQYRTIDSDRPDFVAWHYTAPGSNLRVNATLALLPAAPGADPATPAAWRYTVSLDNPATDAPARIWSEGVHRGTRAAAIAYTGQIARVLLKNKVLHGSRYASRRTAREGSAARWTAESSRNADAAMLARIHEVWRAVPNGQLSAYDAIQRIGAILASRHRPGAPCATATPIQDSLDDLPF